MRTTYKHRQGKLGPDQGVENKSCSANRTFWKLPNVIKNQINTYISSLSTCPVTGSRRGWCISAEPAPERHSPINLTASVCGMAREPASAYSAAISRKVWRVTRAAQTAGLLQLRNFQRYDKSRKTRFGGKKKRILRSLQPFITDLKRSDANLRSSLTKCQNRKKPPWK